MSEQFEATLMERLGSIAATLEHLKERQLAIQKVLDDHIADETASLQRAIAASDILRQELRDLHTMAKLARWIAASAAALGAAALWIKDHIRLS